MKPTALLSAAVLSVFAATSAFGAKFPSPLLVAGGGRVCLVDENGQVAWEKKGVGNVHRAFRRGTWIYYNNGGVWRTDLVTGETQLVYQPAEKEAVWGFELLPNGNIVAAVNALDLIVELQSETWKELVRIKMDPRALDGTTPNGHHHMRMIRKTPKGTYLVCCSGGHVVREYDAKGNLVWQRGTPALAFDCLRRANGNTLVSHLDAVDEYAPDGSLVWSFACTNAPALKLANLCGIQEMPNGNLVLGTYANGKPDCSRTTAFEVTRNKKIVWAYNAPDHSMMTCFRIEGWRWPVGYYVPSADECQKRDAAIDAWAPRAAALKGAAPRRVLVVSRAFGYSHASALAFGARSFARAAEKTGAFAVDCTADVRILADAARLAPYTAVILNNVTYLASKNYPGLREALTGYVAGGKGLVLVHSAVDSFYDDPEIQKMNGGLFCGHPWMAGGTWRFKNEIPGDPVNAAFKDLGATFAFSDEIYMQKTPPFSRKDCRVLLSLDMTDAATRGAADRWGANPKLKHMPLRADGDYAVSWTKDYGRGRVFYTSFGHDQRAFLDARFGHMLDGLAYALGARP